MTFKREVSVGDFIGGLGFVLALVSLGLSVHATDRAEDAEKARAQPATFFSAIVTVGGQRTDSPGIERDSRSLLRRLEQRGVRGLRFPPELVVPADPRWASPNEDAYGKYIFPRAVRVAYEWLLVQVTSGDCIEITRFTYRASRGSWLKDPRSRTDLSRTPGPDRRFNRDLSRPAGHSTICAGEGLLLPLATFTVASRRKERRPYDGVIPDSCTIQYVTKVDRLLTKKRCGEAFNFQTAPSVGLG